MKKIKHFFLYVFECMSIFFVALLGGTKNILRTTGKEPRGIDAFASILGWAVISIGGNFLIIFIKRSIA